MPVGDLEFSDDFIQSLIDHNDNIINGSIKVAGGVEEAKRILENAPKHCNAYDIMYKEYDFMTSWFMTDHNITINLEHLKIALGQLGEKNND